MAIIPSSALANSDRPDVLFIMSDDHASQAVSAYNGIFAEVAPTPSIDRIAKEGMLNRRHTYEELKVK